VWDFYNVLTSNAGSPSRSDVGLVEGHHHRWWQNSVQHQSTGGGNILAYPSSPDDDHPNATGDRKATAEFVPVLNAVVNAWLQPPLSSPPLMTARRQGTRIEITIEKLSSGTIYHLQSCADLRTGSWTDIATFVNTSVLTNWTESIIPLQNSLFYRVKAQ
jgi:hypothetical protein